MACDLVEFVTMHKQEPTAIDCAMHPFTLDVNATEYDAKIIAQRFIVVAGDEDHFLALARASQHLLHHGVLRGAPVDAAPHCPEVDNVTNQEEPFGGVFTEEIKQALGLACACTQVDIGEKNGADAWHEQIFSAAHRYSFMTNGIKEMKPSP
jgi:hypothetical protein